MKLKTILDNLTLLYEMHPDAEINSIGDFNISSKGYRIYFSYRDGDKFEQSHIEVK